MLGAVPAAKPHTLPIYLAAGCVFTALAVRSFVLPLRVDELHGDKVAVGLLFTVGTVTAAGLSLPAGFLADRFGKRTLLLISVVLGGASQLGMGLAGSVGLLFPWQGLAGVSAGASQAALMSALADIVPANRLGRAMGWLTLAFQMGFLAGPAAAGVALQWLTLQRALAVSSALFVVALGLALVGIPASRRRAASWNVVAPLRRIGRQRAFAIGSVGLLGATVLWGTQQAFLPLFGKEHLGLPEAQIGYLIAIQAIANGVSRIPAGRLVDRVPRRELVVVLGLAIYAAGLLFLPHLSGFWPAAVLLSLSVPFMATAYLALGVVFADLATPETRGVAMGVYGVVLYLGLGFGPAAFGPVIERTGYVVGFTACAAAGLAMAAVAALLSRRPPTTRPSTRMAA